MQGLYLSVLISNRECPFRVQSAQEVEHVNIRVAILLLVHIYSCSRKYQFLSDHWSYATSKLRFQIGGLWYANVTIGKVNKHTVVLPYTAECEFSRWIRLLSGVNENANAINQNLWRSFTNLEQERPPGNMRCQFRFIARKICSSSVGWSLRVSSVVKCNVCDRAYRVRRRCCTTRWSRSWRTRYGTWRRTDTISTLPQVRPLYHHYPYCTCVVLSLWYCYIWNIKLLGYWTRWQNRWSAGFLCGRSRVIPGQVKPMTCKIDSCRYVLILRY